jgi:uncharacterized protein (TIGR02594 family)
MAEVPGHQSNPAILAMLKLDMEWPQDDATPWCSGFANWVAWNLGLERTRSLRARSWLFVGRPVELANAKRGDVVIFSRGRWTPGPEVLEAPGHVAFFSHYDNGKIYVVGGNQGDKVSLRGYSDNRLLGIRQLKLEA